MAGRSISRKQFIQVTAALTGAHLIGCETEAPAGPDSGARRDSGTTPRRDSGQQAGQDSGSAEEDSGTPEQDAGGEEMCEAAFITAVIGNNHAGEEHVLQIPRADLMSDEDIEYETTGATDTHQHEITVTAAQFAMLRAGQTVRVYYCTSDGAREHEFALSCVDDPSAATRAMINAACDAM
jgi:hypothetical protein